MMDAIWVLILTQTALCLAAGEIAIRYADWSVRLYRLPERLPAAPLVVGIAILAFGYFVTGTRFLTLLGDADNAAHFHALTAGDPVSEAGRLWVFLALCFLTYPVVTMQYRHSRSRAVVETIVRAFLILFSALAGWVLCTVYHFHA